MAYNGGFNVYNCYDRWAIQTFSFIKLGLWFPRSCFWSSIFFNEYRGYSELYYLFNLVCMFKKKLIIQIALLYVLLIFIGVFFQWYWNFYTVEFIALTWKFVITIFWISIWLLKFRFYFHIQCVRGWSWPEEKNIFYLNIRQWVN